MSALALEIDATVLKWCFHISFFLEQIFCRKITNAGEIFSFFVR